MQTFNDVKSDINNEGMGYYLLDYTDGDDLPDEKSKDLFDRAVRAIYDFKRYVWDKAEEENAERN